MHIEAVSTAQVGSEISGRITTVDFNARVMAALVLARFNREALLAQQAQALSLLASAKAALAQAVTDRDHTARDFVREEGLHARGSISDEDFDTALAAKRTAAERETAAEANFAAQAASVSVPRTNLAHAVIHAPIDGVVITRNIDPGQTVASSFETPVLFTVAADLQKMRVIAAVDETDIGEVAAHQGASFAVHARVRPDGDRRAALHDGRPRRGRPRGARRGSGSVAGSRIECIVHGSRNRSSKIFGVMPAYFTIRA